MAVDNNVEKMWVTKEKGLPVSQRRPDNPFIRIRSVIVIMLLHHK